MMSCTIAARRFELERAVTVRVKTYTARYRDIMRRVKTCWGRCDIYVVLLY